MVFMEESELSSKRWASAPRRSDSPCVLGAPTSREAAGPPVQLEPVDLSVKTPVVLQVPRYSPAAALITAARRIPSPSTTPTPPPLCASTDVEAKSPSRIHGGSKAKIAESPWHAGVLVDNFVTCGAAIISERHVITAAHCVFENTNDLNNVTVILGSSLISKAEEHTVEAIFVHPNWSVAFPYPHDIAVIKLATVIKFDENKTAVVLPKSDVPVNATVTLTGWGVNIWGLRTEDLRIISQKILTNAKCDTLKVDQFGEFDNEYIYDIPLTPYHICGYPGENSGGCEGDSGGALVYKGSVVGIFSWKYECGVGYPNVFTRVYEHVNWIRETIKQ